jgi:acid phosphatase
MVRKLGVSLLTFSLVMTIPIARGAAQSAAGADRLARIARIVVIYEENHSFDNLYGSWEGVNGLASAPPARTIQVNQNGVPFTCLDQNDPTLKSQPPICADTTIVTAPFASHFFNEPFTIDDFIPPTATTCPDGKPGGTPGGCTKDLVHRFYQEQYQLNGGRQNRYTTGSDSVGLTMGVYRTADLPIYRYLHMDGHPHYAIGDMFFQSAFGGSFLNHQWLIAASTPVWPNAVNDGGTNDLHSVVDANGMPISYARYASPSGTAVLDGPLTASCAPAQNRAPTPDGVVCGDYAVNTIQPITQPFKPNTQPSMLLPLQTTPTIGDRLSDAGIDWAWYSGGWSNANGDVNAPGWTNGAGPTCSDPDVFVSNPKPVFPNCPDKSFIYHHQPFNYFARYAPGRPDRAAHLRDEEEFLDLARSSTSECKLKPVSFVKPIGRENEHPGSASESIGSDHLVELLTALTESRCAKDTLIVVTYDEFGGQWDHVTPPGQGGTPGVHDIWGPGTRIPLLVISPFLRGDFVVDHTQYDTTSILATIEHRFGLAPLTSRDASVRDLSTVYDAKSPFEQ